jgi:hypothetical protein
MHCNLHSDQKPHCHVKAYAVLFAELLLECGWFHRLAAVEASQQARTHVHSLQEEVALTNVQRLVTGIPRAMVPGSGEQDLNHDDLLHEGLNV